MIADIISHKKLNPVATELFIRGRKLNISLAFISLSYFAAPKKITLNSTQYFIMKIPNKQELQKIAFSLHQTLTFKTSWIYAKNCTAKPFSFSVIDTKMI